MNKRTYLDLSRTGLILLSGPFVVNVLANISLLLGHPVAKWQGGVTLAWILACCLFGERGWGRRSRLIVQVVCIGWCSVILSGLSVMYTNADAEIYHRASSLFLAQGWNPIFDSLPQHIQQLSGGEGVRSWHVAYLPRAAWIYGAALYQWFGFVEVADSINVLIFIISLIYVFHWLLRYPFSLFIRVIFTGLICFSPVVAGGMFGGSFDSAYYSFLVIALVCSTLYLEERRLAYLLAILIALVMMAGIKYTGITTSLALLSIFGIPQILAVWHSRVDVGVQFFQNGRMFLQRVVISLRDWVVMSCLCFAFIGLIGFSPYVTSWVRHGGPFYPAHTFDKRIALEDKITYDFSFMNEDAKQMGYWGRLNYAYVSTDLTLAYYRWKLNNPAFHPDFKVSGGVGGFGRVFRIAFVISLFMIPCIRLGSVRWWLLFIMLTVLMQPTYYSGYARYVAQFYLFPLLVGICGLQMLINHPVKRWLVWGGMGGILSYAGALLIYPLSFWALQWIISTQNLAIIRAMQKDPAPVMICKTYYSRKTLQDDYGIAPLLRVEPQDSQKGRWYCSYFSTYRYWTSRPIPHFPELVHQASGNDPTIIQSRNAHNIHYFLTSFLPSAGLRFPYYLCDVMHLRWEQFIRATQRSK